MATYKEQIQTKRNELKGVREELISIFGAKGVTCTGSKYSDLPAKAREITSINDMENANGISFGSSTYASNYHLATETQNILTDENGNLLTL